MGLATARRIQKPREIAFALIPTLFAFQQWMEGMLWLSFLEDAQPFHFTLTQAYSLFSQVVWPVYIPVSVLLLEPVPWRRKMLYAITLAGAAVSAFLLYYLVQRPVTSQVNGHHIQYIFPHFHTFAASRLYLLGACIAPLVSSHRYVRIFGVLITASLAITYFFYNAWLISVWCFFAALLSGAVFLHFRDRQSGPGRIPGQNVLVLGTVAALTVGLAALALVDRLELVLAVTLSAVLSAVQSGL